MAVAAGYSATVFASGPSTPFTGDALTLVSGKTYKLNTSAHRILDPSVLPTVKDGGVAVAAANYSVDMLFGTVTFVASYTPGGAITMDGSFVTIAAVPGAFDVKLSRKNTIVDATQYAQGDAQKRRYLTLLDASISLKGNGLALEQLFTLPQWAPAAPYSLNALIAPQTAQANGHYYRATAVAGTGTSSGVQPTWPTGAGATVIDDAGANQITWTEAGLISTLDVLVAPAKPVLLQVDPDGTNTKVFRGWFVLDSEDLAPPLADLVRYTVTGQAAGQGLASNLRAGFSWGSP
jgi:hypothetical protein